MLTTRREAILGGAALLGWHALGKPVRGSLGAKDAPSSGSQPTASDYPTMPNIFHFDGFENAGFGSHDSTAAAWTNLVARRHTGNALYFKGWAFAFRAHSRVLTNAELAANYAVDKARFGLP